MKGKLEGNSNICLKKNFKQKKTLRGVEKKEPCFS